MSEYEWHTSRVPAHLVACVKQRHAPTCERQLRHFALACCRLVWDAMPHEVSRQLVEVAELDMAGLVSRDILLDASNLAVAAMGQAELAEDAPDTFVPEARALAMAHGLAARIALHTALHGCYSGLLAHVRDALAFLGVVRGQSGLETLQQKLCELLRETCGNPFRFIRFRSEWRTDTVLSLARGIYETRDFGAMPILADALQDADCDAADLLGHLRDAATTHLRGCWALDFVLGKEWTAPPRRGNNTLN